MREEGDWDQVLGGSSNPGHGSGRRPARPAPASRTGRTTGRRGAPASDPHASPEAGRRPRVAVVMGSESDRDVVAPAGAALDELGIAWEWRVLSAHRTPEPAAEFARTAAGRGIAVIIAAAGGAAHLPGVIASLTTLPVIGLPVKSAALGGLDSLLSMAQMPPGVPVAVVGVDGARNAALLAAAILALSDPAVAQGLAAFRQQQAARVMSADARFRAGESR